MLFGMRLSGASDRFLSAVLVVRGAGVRTAPDTRLDRLCQGRI